MLQNRWLKYLSTVRCTLLVRNSIQIVKPKNEKISCQNQKQRRRNREEKKMSAGNAF